MSDRCLKLLAPEVSFDAAAGCLDVVASVEQPDRDDEVIDPRTLRLDQYRKNPVVLFVHDQKAFPIAKCETPEGEFTVSVDAQGRLRQKWFFADTPEGRTAAGLYRDRVLRGASIGFVSDGTVTLSPDESQRLYGVARRLRRHVGGVLLETSAVPVPSCPGALALGWLDAPAARAVVRRGGVPNLVTKALKPFLPSASGKPARHTVRVPTRATAVSTTATTTDDGKAKIDKAVSDGVAAVAKTAAAVTTKDMTTTDDTAAPPAAAAADPHENVKAGLMSAGHSAWDAFCRGEMSWDECVAALQQYAEDHGKYGGGGEGGGGDGGESDEEKEVETEADDDEAAEEFEKAVGAIIEKAVAPLRAELAEHKVLIHGTIDTLDAVAPK